MNELEILRDVYALLSELFSSPLLPKEAASTIKRLEEVDKASASLIARFLKENSISEEEYIEMFELDPKCPLYLGAHVYEEPLTCAGAALSERNEYMIDLLGIYRHFGFEICRKELPDYLPLMLEFLSLTYQRVGDPMREKFIREYIAPYLPPMRARLAELKSPYVHLMDALGEILKLEVLADVG